MSVAFVFNDRLSPVVFLCSKAESILLFKWGLKHKIMRGGNDE